MTTAPHAMIVTDAEHQYLRRYLADTRVRVITAVSDLSPAQWTFRAEPERWSIADTVEHLVSAEQLFLQSIATRLHDAPATTSIHDPRNLDARIVARVSSRASRGEAPPQLRPIDRWRADELADRFAQGRDQTLAFVQSLGAGTRLHAIEHPVFGALDGYQWALLTAAHTERHAQQIEEVKAHSDFPPSTR